MKRASIVGVLFRLVLAAVFWAILWVGVNPERIPAGWNPVAPFEVADPITPLTDWRMGRALADPVACLAALEGGAAFQVLADFEASNQCHIKGRVVLQGVGQAQIRPVETRCAVALRLAMWERHSLQPAVEVLGTSLSGITHIGSYNCREIRTNSGSSGRMSTHSTADAIDISGFDFADGREVRLIRDWEGDDEIARFLRVAKEGACKWFRLTLSPDYNAFHADHFHLQSKGWGTCR
ncbi:extensin-like domain-containing protein [Yoonia sp. MH D7]